MSMQQMPGQIDSTDSFRFKVIKKFKSADTFLEQTTRARRKIRDIEVSIDVDMMVEDFISSWKLVLPMYLFSGVKPFLITFENNVLKEMADAFKNAVEDYADSIQMDIKPFMMAIWILNYIEDSGGATLELENLIYICALFFGEGSLNDPTYQD